MTPMPVAAPPAAPRDAESPRVRAAQMATLQRSYVLGLVSSLLAAGLVSVALWPVVAHAQLLAWLAVSALVTGLRLWLLRRARQVQAHAAAALRWERQSLSSAALAGALWGVPCALWMAQVPFEYRMFLVLAIMALTSGATYAYYIWLPQLYCFELPCFLPPFVALALLPGGLATVLGVAGMLYLAMTLGFAHRMHRTQMDSLRLRFENTALLERLQREKEAAERSDQAKSRFLAAASHDLRQPVHALSLYLGVLREQALPARSRHLVDSIGRAADALGGLFDALLNLSRLDAGIVRPRLQPVALPRLLAQLQAEFAPQAAAKGLVLRVRPCAGMVRTDPALLDRILRNLVDNAIVHTARGGVLVACRMRGASLRVQVLDTGPGIPAAERERVFLEFHQLDNPERDRRKGLGLGLAIVRRTALLLGHPLELQSNPGRGSCFSIDLPRTHEPERAPAVPSPVVERAACMAPVLVIEDDSEGRDSLCQLLAAWGYRVLAAAGGVEAIGVANEAAATPALILSDYRLRGHETGIDAVARVHEEFNDDGIPVVLVSGDTDPQRLVEATARGWPLLHKPVAPAALRETLAAVLAERA
jgi:signal transduction histidine kinase/CheY-like chemotaxis protein